MTVAIHNKLAKCLNLALAVNTDVFIRHNLQYFNTYIQHWRLPFGLLLGKKLHF